MSCINIVTFDDFEENVDKIYQVKDQIRNYVKKRQILQNDFETLQANIRKVLLFWTGNTWVGSRKSKSQEKAFQAFFTELYNLLTSDLVEGSQFLYQGTLYRYLGYNSSDKESAPAIEPEYNNIYVSWSKKPKNQYIESKLYGKMTHLTCEAADDYYGIDLSAFDVERPGEEEVVFPTIESTIKSIVIM